MMGGIRLFPPFVFSSALFSAGLFCSVLASLLFSLSTRSPLACLQRDGFLLFAIFAEVVSRALYCEPAALRTAYLGARHRPMVVALISDTYRLLALGFVFTHRCDQLGHAVRQFAD